LITLSEIYAARRRIAGVVRRTPLEHSQWLSDLAGHDVFLKLEAWQRTRSFKLRGAYNAIAALDPADRARGLVTASAGNHGQAVALAARELGARATIFLPTDAPATKKRRIRAFGATLDTNSANYDDAEVAAREFAEHHDATFVHSYSDRAVVAGQGTVAIEILEDMPNVRNLIAPVGGGGLIAGIGFAARSADASIRVIGVQSTATSAMYDAFRAGKVVHSAGSATLADGLAGQVDEISFQRARAVVDEMIVVAEDAIPAAILALFHEGVLAEGAAAVAVAAIMQNAVRIDGPTAIVITGGNIDAGRLATILASD
jgi:threonine dehydratase